MNGLLRWAVVTVVGVHAAIHLLGAAKGLGWASVPQLKHPIGVATGGAWFVAAVAVALAAALLAAGTTWWWAIAALAAVASQAVIMTSWQDAKAGTAVNVLLLVAAVLGYAAHGPHSFDAQWQERADSALQASATSQDLVRETDLAALPGPLAGYLRGAGVVGKPRPQSAYVTFHGRIRSGTDQPWMPFTGRQVNTFGDSPTRTFLMHATRSGLPVTVLHVLDDGHATMRGKVLSLVTVLDAAGPEMDQGETVTVFNDMVVLAPGALLDAPVLWTTVSDREVRGTFSSDGQVVSATLHFNAAHELVDFVSDDRLAASADGHAFTARTWSTPIATYRQFGTYRLPARGEARWHKPAPEGEFAYIELTFDGISYDPPTSAHPP